MSKKKGSTITTFETNADLYLIVKDKWDKLGDSPVIRSKLPTDKGLLQIRFRDFSGWVQITPNNYINVQYREGEEKPEEMVKAFLQVLALETFWVIPRRLPEETESEFQRRKLHSNDLKSKVIRPWLSRLDKAIPEILPKEKDVSANSTVSSVDEILLEDFRLHIDPEVFILQEELERMRITLEERKRQLLLMIDDKILQVFKNLELSLSNGQGGKRFVNRNLSRMIFAAAYYWEKDREYFREYYNGYFSDSQIENDGYWAHGLLYVRFLDIDVDKDRLKHLIDEKMFDLLVEVKDSIYSSFIEKTIIMRRKMIEIQEDLKRLLKECVNIITFQGTCRYV